MSSVAKLKDKARDFERTLNRSFQGPETTVVPGNGESFIAQISATIAYAARKA